MEYVKICGLKKYEHVDLCIKYGADAVGFIYNVPESLRNLQTMELKTLLEKIKNKISTVVVLKPSSVQELEEVVNNIDASYFQIHVNFKESELEILSKDHKQMIILALKVNQANKESVIQLINKFYNDFFAFLIDNSEGQGNELDLKIYQEILKEVSATKIIVAGGISIENAEEIIDVLKPYGIDVSSSLEVNRGVKDPIKIKDFLNKINEIKQIIG
jgi:phosphoribosylanthranilate isomerase